VEFTPKSDVPLGKRFTDVYRQRGEPAADSERMRRRIASLFSEHGQGFEHHVEAELGIQTPWSISASWNACFRSWSVEDVLNALTVLAHYIRNRATTEAGRIAAQRTIVLKLNRIFEQENVAYRMDPRGGVHFLHDGEFTRSAQATIAGLSRPRYANSLDRFESSVKAISNPVPDGKTGIRNVFEAAEGLFRLMFTKAPRLTTDQVAQLEPIIQKRYSGDGRRQEPRAS
jgi:hypothetical protein